MENQQLPNTDQQLSRTRRVLRVSSYAIAGAALYLGAGSYGYNLNNGSSPDVFVDVRDPLHAFEDPVGDFLSVKGLVAKVANVIERIS